MNRNIKHVSTPFGDIAYTENGTGPAALFVHGVFLNGYYWRHVIDRVADTRRCIAVDLLAHGATGASAVQDLSFSAQADMLDAFCTALALEPVDLVANDSGGGIMPRPMHQARNWKGDNYLGKYPGSTNVSTGRWTGPRMRRLPRRSKTSRRRSDSEPRSARDLLLTGPRG